ncbi:MAG: hypothetical protein QNI99_06095 [Woeseiaceae bacterium]|nr:hypothetical protein [Woeseiaceae bacterium]
MDASPVRIATTLVIGTTIVVAVLAVILMYLEAERLWSLIVAMLFLPVSMAALFMVTRRMRNHERAMKLGGNLRAGLVGAGVLLATSLAFRITDTLGWTGGDAQLDGRSIIVFMPAVVAVLIEVLGARLEYEAEKDPDADEQ